MRLCLLAFLAVFLTGCAYDVANRYYASEKYPPNPVDSVEILSEEPTRRYEVIADFQSRGETEKSLRRKAAKIGADAVIVTHLGGYYKYSEDWAKETSSAKDWYSRIIGSAIRYK